MGKPVRVQVPALAFGRSIGPTGTQKPVKHGISEPLGLSPRSSAVHSTGPKSTRGPPLVVTTGVTTVSAPRRGRQPRPKTGRRLVSGPPGHHRVATAAASPCPTRLCARCPRCPPFPSTFSASSGPRQRGRAAADSFDRSSMRLCSTNLGSTNLGLAASTCLLSEPDERRPPRTSVCAASTGRSTSTAPQPSGRKRTRTAISINRPNYQSSGPLCRANEGGQDRQSRGKIASARQAIAKMRPSDGWLKTASPKVGTGPQLPAAAGSELARMS